MGETELSIFVAIIRGYFESQTGKAPEVGSPFLGEPEALPIDDYTGVIGISGNRKGCVYFTAPAELLRQVLSRAGESNLSEANLADLSGEIANTISGNARREFGKDFLISVPIVIQGTTQSIKVPRGIKAYVIPFVWQKQEAALVVSVT
jgi:chemotaxis protein CheX